MEEKMGPKSVCPFCQECLYGEEHDCNALKIVCSKCNIEVKEGMFWVTNPGDKIICKECLPKNTEKIGVRH